MDLEELRNERNTDIRTLHIHSNLTFKHFKLSVLWFGCDNGDNDGENGDRMRANDFTDMYNGWKQQQKHTQPCFNHLVHVSKCVPL